MALLTAVAAAFCAGCGSGGSTGARGALAMTVDWPARSAGLLPQGTQSVCVTIEDGGGMPLTDPRLIRRKPGTGSETVTISGLAPGLIVAAVEAHGQLDGKDPPISVGKTSGMIEEGKTAKITVSMNSTVAFIEVEPRQFGLAQGKTQKLTATAFDVQKRLLLGPTYTWSSGNEQVATVDASGRVTAVGFGPVTIFVREEASGVVGQVDTFVESAG